MFRTVVWASDGSAAAERSLPWARGIAQNSGARLIAVYVNEVGLGRAAAAVADLHDEGQAAVRRAVEALQQDGINAEFVTGNVMVGGVAQVIADFARDADADLIVTGTRGRNPLVGLLVGSVTRRLLEIAPCPVLAVPSTQPRQSGDS
ncbi:universal stress protein UspA [Pseudonocardia asaccharolytica DSM 44247 = NBRC 16224]|uniref:Universal stress protein UspA n=2 Tax=Pseudonocardia asaccharolytica TaxID=54010 RepID=A0A511D679_9PSEU|nr:universal stress protein UspA [Pseudonocardia asaccharolytica DSM 44247 = NBRC 16224]